MIRVIANPAFGLATLLAAAGGNSAAFDPDVPRTWEPQALSRFELPLAKPQYTPIHVSETYYYGLAVRPVYRSYPIYHPDHEPPGYREELLKAEPEVIFDPSELRTREDWVRAGALVFHQPIDYESPFISSQDVTDPAWYKELNIALTAGGIMPYARWIVREQGRLEVGNVSCAMCHIRVMPDGSVIEGAQGNFPLGALNAARRQGRPLHRVTRALVRAPWSGGEDPSAMTDDEVVAAFAAMPPGVSSRQGTSLLYPVKVPDLIGVRDRKYLDATGLGVHRGPGDIMRYAALNQSLDMLASFGGYIPGADQDGSLPAPGTGWFVGTSSRYSDTQLYALALYLYSLEPPENPHSSTKQTRRGRQLFESEGCGGCHTPPLYTNNMLVPAPGFDPPEEHYRLYDVMNMRVNTDSTLSLTTRRGTGYYKVPSLKGVWYRGPFEHNGSVATLEDWFDPRRREDDYVPTGLAPPDGSPRPVRGHPFGLTLSNEDREALIAFLRTL